MKIVIATTLLYDAKSPFNHLFKDIILEYLKAGHEVVRIVACVDKKSDDYKMDIISGKIKYIPVIRKKSVKSNIISRYILDTITAIRMSKIIRDIDADILFEDTLYTSYWTTRTAKRKKMRVIAMLQDVWPDNAVQSNLIKEDSLIYRYFDAWQRAVYKLSDKIICISDDMKRFIIQKGVPESKISVIYNWGYSDEKVDISWEDNEFVKKYNLSKHTFYAVYAGNIGRMQNVELILRTAKLLEYDNHIRFLIVGEGVQKSKIEQMALNMKLINVDFIPFQPSSLATAIYSAAGVNLVTLVKGGIRTALPSKTGIILSCGNSAVFAFGSDSCFAGVLENHKVFCCINETDEKALAEKIVLLSKETMTNKDYSVFENYFMKSKNVQLYVEALNE